MATVTQELDLDRYQLGWSDVEDFYVFKPKKASTRTSCGRCPG